MFVHNLKYILKILFKNKALIFWTFAFPIILGSFFKMAFSNIERSEKLDIIDIAIVNNEEYKSDRIFKSTFDVLGDESSENHMFNIKYVNEKEADELLSDDEIVGYLKFENNSPQIIVKNNGIDQTILKYAVDEIIQTTAVVYDIGSDKVKDEIINFGFDIDYEKIYTDIAQFVQNQEANIRDVSNSHLSYTMIEFYTLIAMTCLYGGIIGMTAINYTLPNMSNNGKRISVSPVKKLKLVLSTIFASYIVQIIGISLLFLFTIFVLKVDYGDNLPLMILLGLIGSFAGLSLGIALGTNIKANENTKTGLIIATSMLGCYLAGMMGITMKYVVDKNVPIINKINPASMITDGFYSLYYYDTLDRYVFNIVSLIIFSVIMIIISFEGLRRTKYDSI